MNITFQEPSVPDTLIRSTEIDPFTQKSFWELCLESFSKHVPHVIGRIETADTQGYTYYDARQLCKSLFELEISKEGRKVRMKSQTNPVDDRLIKEIVFFEIDSENPGKALCIGTQKEFLASSTFRSRVFNRNDPFDALSINFVFKDQTGGGMKKKTRILVYISLFVLLTIFIVCTLSILQNGMLYKSLSEMKMQRNGESH